MVRAPIAPAWNACNAIDCCDDLEGVATSRHTVSSDSKPSTLFSATFKTRRARSSRASPNMDCLASPFELRRSLATLIASALAGLSVVMPSMEGGIPVAAEMICA
ncbi:hypothetical protein D3C74_373580 [compost metagenome]